MALDDTLALPFFDDGHRRFAEELSRWADAKLPSLPHDDVDAACRARVKALGEAGLLKAVVPQLARRPASGARCADALPRPRNPGVPRRARRFRLRHAGARHRLDLAVRLRGAEAQISAAGARRQGHRGLRAVGARGRLRRRGDGHDRQSRRCTFPARRRKDLDIERRNRRPLRRVRAHAARRRARAGCRPSWSMPIRRG